MTKELAALKAIAREMEALPGHLGFYYKNLATGFEYGVRENEAYLAASVIKFPLLLHVLEKAAAGEIALTDKLTVEDWEKLLPRLLHTRLREDTPSIAKRRFASASWRCPVDPDEMM